MILLLLRFFLLREFRMFSKELKIGTQKHPQIMNIAFMHILALVR